MTLRARFALALGLLAALSVVVVAVAGYLATAHQLHSDLDNEVVSYASRFTDPGGRTAQMLCDQLSHPTEFAGANPLQGLGGILAGLPQGAIECVDPSGTVTGWTGLTKLPVDETALRPGAAASTAPSTTPTSGAPGAPHEGGSGGGPDGGEPAGPPAKVSAPRTETMHGTSYRVVTVSLPGGGEVLIARSLADTNSTLSSIRTLAALVGVAVIALAAAGGWLSARRSARPVQRLTTAAE